MRYKFTSVILIAAALLFTLPGCAGQTQSSETTQADNGSIAESPAETAQAEQEAETAAPAAQSAGSAEKFNIGHLPATGHILYFIAQEEGFYQEEGLDVTLTQFDNNPAELAALESGKIDVAPINATNLISFLGSGHQITSIGGVMSDGHALVVAPEVVEGVEPEDYSLELLKGKTIILQAGSTYDIEFRKALTDAGFDLEKDITILTADSGTSAYNSLKNKEIDGAAVYAPFRQKAIDEGFVPLLYCDEIEYFDHPICCRDVGLTENIEQNPEKFKAFTKAMIRAGEFLENNHAGAVKDAKKYLDMDEKLLEGEIYNHSVNNPDPDRKKTETFYHAMDELGYITNPVNITDYINSTIYEEALQELLDESPDNAYYQYLKTYHENA